MFITQTLKLKWMINLQPENDIQSHSYVLQLMVMFS